MRKWTLSTTMLRSLCATVRTYGHMPYIFSKRLRRCNWISASNNLVTAAHACLKSDSTFHWKIDRRSLPKPTSLQFLHHLRSPDVFTCSCTMSACLKDWSKMRCYQPIYFHTAWGFPRFYKCNVPNVFNVETINNSSMIWICWCSMFFCLGKWKKLIKQLPPISQEQKWETALAMVNLNNSIRHQIGSRFTMKWVQVSWGMFHLSKGETASRPVDSGPWNDEMTEW